MQRKASFLLSLLACFGLTMSLVSAQLSTPAASPFSKTETTVGLTDITIEYSRPSAKGRKIVGDLVPYGEMWRTGANASTKISFSDDVKLNGNKVPAGKYAFYLIPGKEEWTVVVHKNLNHWGTGADNYKQEEDLVRFNVKAVDMGLKVETFTILIGDVSDESANIYFMWENVAVPVKLEVEVDNLVMDQIEQLLAGPSAGTYYQMASYYYTHDKDMNKALEWVDKALDGGERYWIATLKARIHAKLNQYDQAIAASEKALKLAEGNNPDYVRMNKKMIAEWKAR